MRSLVNIHLFDHIFWIQCCMHAPESPFWIWPFYVPIRCFYQSYLPFATINWCIIDPSMLAPIYLLVLMLYSIVSNIVFMLIFFYHWHKRLYFHLVNYNWYNLVHSRWYFLFLLHVIRPHSQYLDGFSGIPLLKFHIALINPFFF